jgi:hypothetical protein
MITIIKSITFDIPYSSETTRAMEKLTFVRSTLKQGALMGLGFCLYTTLMWLTKLDSTYLNIGQYLDMAIIVLPIIIIFWAIRQENNSYGVSVLDRIGVAIFVALISFIIYDPFLYAYHHYINPQWFDSVLSLKENDLKANHFAQEKIVEELQKMRSSGVAQAGLYRPSAAIASVLLVPILIAFLSLIFVKSKRKVRQKKED